MTASALTITSPTTQLPAPTTLADVQTYAKLFADSKMFTDITQMAQASVKIIAGSELGIKPFAAMNGIHIIKGKTTLSAGLMATLIKRSGRYNYRVQEHTDAICKIAFFEQGEPCGVSEFSIEDASKANLLSNTTWKNYPRNMLFARALSNGARWYTADIFGGPVYTPEEMGADVNGDGDVIDIPSTPVHHAQNEAQTQETTSTATVQTAEPDLCEVARKEFLRCAALFGIPWKELSREQKSSWLTTLLNHSFSEFTPYIWKELATGMGAYLQFTQGDESMLTPEYILPVAQRVWTELGSLLQMSNAQWQGVIGILEEEQAQQNHLREIAAPSLVITEVSEPTSAVSAEDAERTLAAIRGN